MALIRRRWFLGALAAFAVAGAGFWTGTRRPAPDLISSTCEGTDLMPRKILVAYATRTGSTAEVAQAIGRRLCAAGLGADVRPIAEVDTLDGYDGAVLGSAIRYAAWLPEIVEFLKIHRGRLSEMPVAFFTMHMLALGDAPEVVAERTKYTAMARQFVDPIEEAFFEGMIDMARLSLFDRIAVRLVKSPVGDRRDWQRIGNWADALARRLA